MLLAASSLPDVLYVVYQAGKALINSVNYMPSITPYGRYRIVVTGLLPDGLPDICAEIHFDVGSGAPRLLLPANEA